MKILILSNGIPSATDPHFGCFAMDQARSLSKSGHDVAVLCVNTLIGKKWSKPGFRHWRQEGITCFETFGLPTAFINVYINRKVGRYLENCWVRWAFKRVVRHFGFPDIVHAHYLEEMIHGAAIKEKYPIKLVGTEHWSKIAEDTPPSWIMDSASLTYPRMDRLICVSDYLRKIIFSRFNIDSIVCGNVLPEEFTATPPSNTVSGEHPFTFVSCGRLISLKCFDIIIKAAHKLAIPREKWRIKIIGDGPDMAKLQHMISHLKLENNIFLTGRLERQQIAEILYRSDSFILASKRETFGVVVIEALSTGLPVICTRCGGTDELINAQNGIYVNVNDVDQMAEAMEFMYNNGNSYDRESIRRDCLHHYSQDAIAANLTEIYTELINSD